MIISHLKKVLIGVVLAAGCVLAVIGPAIALDIPSRPRGYVTDRAGLLPQDVQRQIEQALRRFEQQTTNQIVVVTFPSLEGESLEDFSIRLAEQWKIGQKDKDNGVILLIFQEERKIRIEVGYGLEGALTDAESGLIISEAIAPYFRQNNYSQGIAAGVSAIMTAVEGEYQAPASRASASGYGRGRELTAEQRAAIQQQTRAAGILVLIIVGILLVIDLGRYGKYAAGHRGYRERYSFWEWFFRFALLLAVISMLMRVLFYTMLFSRGGYGGSRGGGGFSGGGGSFGGGGASGGW